MDFKRALDEEIASGIGELKKLGVNTDEYTAAAENLSKLMDRSIELTKVDADVTKSEQGQKTNVQIKEMELEASKRNDRITNLLTAAGIIVPTVVTVWGTIKSLKFEQTGTLTTLAGKNFLARIFRK